VCSDVAALFSPCPRIFDRLRCTGGPRVMPLAATAMAARRLLSRSPSRRHAPVVKGQEIMKRQSRKKLTLDRTTIATLSSKELKDAVGGALPPTRETHCGTECEPTNFCL
jgi:hypothetical protein